MKRVLVISYFYPPFASVGALRVSKMTRYLSDYGWEASVLTTALDDRPTDFALEIPPERVHRVAQSFDVLRFPRAFLGRRSVQGNRFIPSGGRGSSALWQLGMLYRNVVCFPDPQIGFRRPAVREGLRLIEEIQPEVILTSSLPNTAHVVGAALSKRTGVPWIADFRDLWTDNHNFRRVAPLRALERVLERSILRRAAALVTVSEVWADVLRRRFGRPTHVVPNGFDPSDYPDAAPSSGKFTLTYTGMFYNGKQSAAPLLGAIAALQREGIITPNNFHLRLVGHYLEPVLAAARVAGVLPLVTLEAAVPYSESLRLQRAATALLFFDWLDGRESGWYSAKLYEYLGARRPILSIGPPSSVAGDLLRRTGAGVVVGTEPQARAVLEGWLREYTTTGTLPDPTDPAALVQYHRQAAAARMANVLNEYARR